MKTLLVIAGFSSAMLLVSSSLGAATPTLRGRVGPGRTIELQTVSGAPVRRLHAGTYVVLVSDQSTKDDFHLQGPGGFSRKTGIRFRGRVTWRLRLARGRYRYFSDRHPALGGTFRVV